MISTHEYQDQTIGTIKVRKVTRARRLRIRPYADHVLVTIPKWVAFKAGHEFALSQAEWIERHRPEANSQFLTGDRVGKQHVLEFKTSDEIASPRSRINGTRVCIEYPSSMSASNSSVQSEVQKAVTRALRKEAEQYLPHRVSLLASDHGFRYTTITIKQLKTRWGSCSNTRAINLNLQLMRLPTHLIDYVILHELTHTKHLNHSHHFWAELEMILPNYKSLRSELKMVSAQ